MIMSFFIKNEAYFSTKSNFRNKTHQKEKNRSLSTSVLAGAGGFEPATHGFGVALKARKVLKILDFRTFEAIFHAEPCVEVVSEIF